MPPRKSSRLQARQLKKVPDDLVVLRPQTEEEKAETARIREKQENQKVVPSKKSSSNHASCLDDDRSLKTQSNRRRAVKALEKASNEQTSASYVPTSLRARPYLGPTTRSKPTESTNASAPSKATGLRSKPIESTKVSAHLKATGLRSKEAAGKAKGSSDSKSSIYGDRQPPKESNPVSETESESSIESSNSASGSSAANSDSGRWSDAREDENTEVAQMRNKKTEKEKLRKKAIPKATRRRGPKESQEATNTDEAEQAQNEDSDIEGKRLQNDKGSVTKTAKGDKKAKKNTSIYTRALQVRKNLPDIRSKPIASSKVSAPSNATGLRSKPIESTRTGEAETTSQRKKNNEKEKPWSKAIPKGTRRRGANKSTNTDEDEQAQNEDSGIEQTRLRNDKGILEKTAKGGKKSGAKTAKGGRKSVAKTAKGGREAKKKAAKKNEIEQALNEEWEQELEDEQEQYEEWKAKKENIWMEEAFKNENQRIVNVMVPWMRRECKTRMDFWKEKNEKLNELATSGLNLKGLQSEMAEANERAEKEGQKRRNGAEKLLKNAFLKNMENDLRKMDKEGTGKERMEMVEARTKAIVEEITRTMWVYPAPYETVEWKNRVKSLVSGLGNKDSGELRDMVLSGNIKVKDLIQMSGAELSPTEQKLVKMGDRYRTVTLRKER